MFIMQIGSKYRVEVSENDWLIFDEYPTDKEIGKELADRQMEEARERGKV